MHADALKKRVAEQLWTNSVPIASYAGKKFETCCDLYVLELNQGMLCIDTVGTPGLGYPLLLCLGKGLVVILSYALMAEQPDPCGPEPYSPGKWPQTRSLLGRVR